MRQLISTLTIIVSMLTLSCNGQNEAGGTVVLLETTAGDVRIRLYDETPQHRDNFIKNVQEGLYDGVTFHRVIRNFMVQTGDPDTRPGHEAELAAAAADTTGNIGETIPAEILFPQHIHRRGVVAAAREGDDVNPDKRSDAYQFYIVTGRFQNEMAMAGYEQARKERKVQELYNKKMQEHGEELDKMRRARNTYGVSNLLESLLDDAKMEVDENPPAAYTSEHMRAYRVHGGAPWLDGDYTVFGEVIEGMKTVLDIEKVKTDASDKPLKEIRIVRASVEE